MDSYLRLGSTSPVHRTRYPISNTWKFDDDTSRVRVRIGQSAQRDYSRSPIDGTSSPSYNRYSSDLNLSMTRRPSSIYDSPTSRSRDRARRFSMSGIHLPLSVSHTRNSSLSWNREHSSSPQSSIFNRPRVYSPERKPPLNYLDKFRPAYSSPSPSPSRSSGINFTPTRLDIGSTYGRTYNAWNSYNTDEGAHSNDFKRSSFVPSYSSLASTSKRDWSTPAYSRYSSSPSYHTSMLSHPRSSSLSRFSYRSFATSSSSDNFERDESFGSKIFNVLNKFSGDVYENKPTRNLADFSSNKTFYDSGYIKYDSFDSSKMKTLDSPRKTARELFNDIKDILEDNKREKDFLDRAKNEYGKHQRRLSTLLMSYKDSTADNTKMPNTLEATFTSTSRRSLSRDSMAGPIIKIEQDEENQPKSDFHENLTGKRMFENIFDEPDHKDVSNKDLAKLLQTDNPEELAKVLLERGECFKPNEISTTILPSGEKAVIMTQIRQTAIGEDGLKRKSMSPSPQSANLLYPSYYGSNPSLHDEDQEWANEEIEKFTHITGEFEESLQTLEHFIGRNRYLFPENLIIYQKIVYHKSPSREISKHDFPSSRRFSFVDDDQDICAVRVREKLVLPYGCRKNGYDVMEMLRRCYPRFEEVEVVYDDEENIKETLLKQENGKLNPFDDDFDHPKSSRSRRLNSGILSDDDSGRNSPDEDELLQRCRRGEECLPYFVTTPKSQSTLVGQPVRFTCSIAGNPEPEVQWYKDGLPLPKDGRFAATNNFGICSLRICPTRADDKGIYTVEIENSVGVVSADVELDLQSTGQQLKRPKNSLAFSRIPPYYVHMTEGDPLTLRCKLQGDVAPKVTWYKGSKEIRADGKYRLVAEGEWQYMLQILNLEPSDAALYTVVADDGVSSVKHSIEVNVAPKRDDDDTITEYEIVKKMGPIKMAPVFVKELPHQYRVKEGGNLLIGCEVNESDPQPRVIGVEIVEKKRKKSDGRDSRASDYYTTSPTYDSPLPWRATGDTTLVSPVEG